MKYKYQVHSEDKKKFFEDRIERMARGREYAENILSFEDKYLNEISQFRKDGCILLKNFFSKEFVEIIKCVSQKMDRFIEEKKYISKIKSPDYISKIKSEGYDLAKESYGQDSNYIDEETLKSKSFSLRENVAWAGIEDPLVNIPELIDLVFYKELVGLACAYFGAVPLLTFIKLRTSFVNALDTQDTEFFHVDGGSFRIFKAIIYLNDVIPGGGPFSYIKGSHRQKFENWEEKSHYADQELASIYGADKIFPCYGNVGDLFLAETTGYHRGENPFLFDRRILIVNYCMHKEYGFDYPQIKMLKRNSDKLSGFQGLVADGLETI